MASNDWILPVVAIGGLIIGGTMFLPQIMKSLKFGNGGTTSPESYTPEEVEEFMEKYRQDILSDPDAFRPPLPPAPPSIPLVDVSDLVEDDAYLITDEDFKKLDIGKKDRRFLNAQRKLRDARLDRVVYGDDGDRPLILPPYIFGGYVNTVSPYGQGPARELVRLPYSEGMSRSNTKSNTINLY